MEQITITKELQDFLEKEGVLESFIENSQKHYRNIGGNEKVCITEVAEGFLWSDTAQGYDFWYKLDIKWEDYQLKNENRITN